jgi:hypothetical protein
MFVQKQKAGRLRFFLVGQNDHRSNRAFIWGSVQAPIGIAAFVTACGRCTTVSTHLRKSTGVGQARRL